jgi:tetratricopeptide (TPR) repeat protein
VLAFYDWEFAKAEEAFTRALTLNPNSEIVRDWYGWYLLWPQRWDDAIGQLRKAVTLDPLSLIIKTDLGLALLHAGRWDEAIDQTRSVFELDPDNSMAFAILGWAYIGKSMYRDAVKSFERAVDTSKRQLLFLYQLAIASAWFGDTVRSLSLKDEVRDALHGKPRAWYMTEIYRALARRDRRYESQYFSWLEKAYDEHDLLLVWTSSNAVIGKPSNSLDPRWIAFRKRFGLPP